MFSKTFIQRLGGVAVLLVFLSGWSLKTVHVFWEHTDVVHHESDCQQEHSAANVHFHKSYTAEDDCPYCAFSFSCFEEIALPLPVCQAPDIDIAPLSPYYAPLLSARTFAYCALRGPPAV